MKFLVAEPSLKTRTIIINVLRELRHVNIEEVADGQDAYTKLVSDKFDFLITEWDLPGMDGISLANIIRNDKEMHAMPIVMVSSRKDRDDILKARRSKLNGYITKPLISVTLKMKMEEIINGAKKSA
jgi:two-component system chemotaxis response regulator CheY